MKKAFAAAVLALALLMPRLALGEMPMEEGTPFTLTSPSVILTEPRTGKVIFEKNADERRPVASVTKVMTILLTMEAIDDGRVSLGDSVPVSARASGMGGSQVFLDANKNYKLRDLLESVIVASAVQSQKVAPHSLLSSIYPIDTTPSGMTISVSAVHFWKVLAPRKVRPVPRSTSLRCSKERKV